MTWNYRVMRRNLPKGEKFFGIYEVYYRKNKKSYANTVEHVGPRGDTMKELKEDWLMMAEAFFLPVLDYKTRKPIKEKKK